MKTTAEIIVDLRRYSVIAGKPAALELAAEALERLSPGTTSVALTARESEVLHQLAKGFTVREISTQLRLSRYTVAQYVRNLYRKLDVSSRAEATVIAMRLGLA